MTAQADLDHMIRPLGLAAIEAAQVRAGERVLDIGCGCGDTTLALALRVAPGGTVTGMDVSEPMIARARARAPDLAFQVADASTATAPEVDVLYSRFGVMFFADPVAAFAHLRRALAPSGRLAFVCWRELAANLWASLPLQAANRVLGPGDPTPPGEPGPFAFADRRKLLGTLESAGFSSIDIRPLDLAVPCCEAGDDETLRAAFARIGPAARRLAEAPPDLRERAIGEIVAEMRTRVGPNGVALPAACWIVTARR